MHRHDMERLGDNIGGEDSNDAIRKDVKGRGKR